MSPNTNDVFANCETAKSWGKKEMKTEISYFDILLAKLFKETEEDFATLTSAENLNYFYDKRNSLETYLKFRKIDIDKPKSLKIDEKQKMAEELKKLSYRNFPLRNDINKYFNFVDIENMNCFNQIYFFPEVFKHNMSQDRFNYLNITDFILNKNLDLKSFSVREQLEIPFENKIMTHEEFYEFTLNYLFADEHKDSFERQVLKYESDFLKTKELNKFRNLSLGHSLIYTIDKLITADVLNSDKYLNLVCTGGVCNTKNMVKSINKDIQSLLTISHDSNKQDYVKMIDTKYDDYSTSFYKGANFISKLPDLENIMISRQQYYDHGSDFLSYCYI